MWDYKCLAAALCFFTSNVLFFVDGVLLMKERAANANDENIWKYWNEEYQNWAALDPTYLESQWMKRRRQRPIEMSAALLGAMAWFWMMVPIVQSAWVLSHGGKRAVGAHVTLAGLAVFGGIIELLARLMIVGMTNASEWMAKDFNLDDWSETGGDGMGWRVLEMIHIASRGMLLWIDTFEAMALFGIVMVIFYSLATEPKFRLKRSSTVTNSANGVGADASSRDTAAASEAPGGPPPQAAFTAAASRVTRVPVKPTFTGCFAWSGLFVGVLAVATFLADVLRFVDWGFFGNMAIVTSNLLGVGFLPLWLICLARQLPKATGGFELRERRISDALGAQGEELAALKGSENEII